MPEEIPTPGQIRIERLGEKLRTIRQRAGLTLDQMAARLGRTEPARRVRVHEWEIGRRTPNLVTILGYARFADISTDVLLDDALDLPPAEDQD
jgi:transcriptional regulator with XRE-family HTH domain